MGKRKAGRSSIIKNLGNRIPGNFCRKSTWNLGKQLLGTSETGRQGIFRAGPGISKSSSATVKRGHNEYKDVEGMKSKLGRCLQRKCEPWESRFGSTTGQPCESPNQCGKTCCPHFFLISYKDSVLYFF